MREHAAPWGKLLLATSFFAALICVGITILMWSRIGAAGSPGAWIALFPLFVLAFSALFMVRGYVVTADEILIRRPLWSTRLARNRLQEATADPSALRGSIRLFGNGGLFSITGVFRSPALGRYRAFVTDPSRVVVLRFSDRVVVVSPEDPARFVRDVSPAR